MADKLSLDQIAEALAEPEVPSVVQDIADPAHGHVHLSGGLLRAPGEPLVRDAEVRELTGEHEETIAKARRSPSVARFVSALLECGIAKLGGEVATREDIKKLLIGDRDQLLIEIRRATYGEELTFEGLICPECGERLDVTVTLDEIPQETLKDPEDRRFEVKLRHGKALVRLPNGEDQEFILADPELTDPERNTVMLQRCVISLTDAQGNEHPVAGLPALVRKLGIVDRRTILSEIAKRQPGPRYDGVKFTHESCGKEVPLRFGLGDLFPDL